jgi:hypothetical protein
MRPPVGGLAARRPSTPNLLTQTHVCGTTVGMTVIKSETVKFRLPPRMLSQLRDAAYDQEMPVGEFLRFLISQYLESQEEANRGA